MASSLRPPSRPPHRPSTGRLLLRGGRILTPTGYASALLVDGDTISWVGDDVPGPEIVTKGGSTSNEGRLDGDGERVVVVELGGRLVTPAFVDAHVHLAETGFAALGADLSGAGSAAEALELLADHARETALGVVLAAGWDESRWAAGEPLTRSAVDRAVGHRPAYVSRVDLHSAVASSALLEVVAARAPERLTEASGWSADGPLSRDAHHAVRDVLRTLLTPEDRATAIRTALRAAAARGIGAVHEMGAPHINPADDLDTARRLRAEAHRDGGALPEVVGYWGEVGADLAGLRRAGVAGAAGDACADGAVGSRTAALDAPYADAPSTRGHLYLTAHEIAEHVVACTEAGLQAGFHVIGDRAVAEVVAGFEKAAAQLGDAEVRRARHRLEHLEMVTAAQIDVLARLGVTASMQPLFQEWWGGPGGLYETRLGDRSRGMNAYGALAAAGVPLAFGSDSPVTPFDPWGTVRAATRHQDDALRLDGRTAFDAHTRGGWRAAGVDDSGVLAAGAPATLAVWDTDPARDVLADLDSDGGHLPRCLLTLVGGVPAHDTEGTLS